MERKPYSWRSVLTGLLAFVVSMTIAFGLLPPDARPRVGPEHRLQHEQQRTISH